MVWSKFLVKCVSSATAILLLSAISGVYATPEATPARPLKPPIKGSAMHGRGNFQAKGSGTASVSANGLISVKGEGTLKVTANNPKQLFVKGFVETNHEGDVITYTGNGRFFVKGEKLTVDFDGTVDRILVGGSGKALLNGTGTYSTVKGDGKWKSDGVSVEFKK
ncbi:MAG: hypothetical protein WCO51_01340 [bacterium]|jgi:hypothetical protein